MVTIEGNGIIKIVFVSKYLSGNFKWLQVVINYNFLEGVTNEEETLLVFELNLFSIRVITLSNHTITKSQITSTKVWCN
jgi:hypothetical protein